MKHHVNFGQTPIDPKQHSVALVYLAMEGADYIVPDEMEYGMKRTPSLGLQYLASTLKNSGIHCRIYDQPAMLFDPSTLLRLLEKQQATLVGFYSDTFLKPKVVQWIQTLKSEDLKVPIIVGGPGSFDKEIFLDAGAAMVCHGEGEKTILDVVSHMQGDLSLDAMQGVSYLQNEQLVDSPPQSMIDEIDSIPFPDRGQYPPDTYYDYHYFGMRQPYVSMLASRGCPNRCAFCASSSVLGRRVRQRSVENVIQEIDGCISDFGLKYIGFKDDIFGLKPGWVEEFSEELIRRKSPVKYAINLYPLSFKKDLAKKLRLMRMAGLDQVVVGLQSVDPKVLKSINRRTEEPALVKELVGECKKLGITSVVEFIFGLPGDSDRTMKGALDYSLNLRPNHALFYVLSVLDGSQIMDEYGPEGPDTGFTDEQLRKRCADYQKKFFTRPGVALNNIFHILRNNPKWFLRIFRHWRYLINAIGIKGKKKSIGS